MVIDSNNTEDLKEKRKNVLINLQKRFDIKFLTVNVEKTEMINFYSCFIESEQINIDIDKQAKIDNVAAVKFLGIRIDSRLIWSYPIDYIASKLEILSYQLKMLRNNVSISTAITAYHACVFNCKIWHNIPEKCGKH